MKRIIYLLIGLCSVLGLQAQNFGSPAMRKLQLAEFAISNLYVDTVNENKLVESAIIEMLAQLDPHSTYSDAEEVKKMNEPLQGNFEGIGVQFQMIEDTLLIVQPVSNGPSEKVGILAGDRIIAVNDTAIAGVKMGTEEIMGRLRPDGNLALHCYHVTARIIIHKAFHLCKSFFHLFLYFYKYNFIYTLLPRNYRSSYIKSGFRSFSRAAFCVTSYI